jgi:hypothetical protein
MKAAETAKKIRVAVTKIRSCILAVARRLLEDGHDASQVGVKSVLNLAHPVSRPHKDVGLQSYRGAAHVTESPAPCCRYGRHMGAAGHFMFARPLSRSCRLAESVTQSPSFHTQKATATYPRHVQPFRPIGHNWTCNPDIISRGTVPLRTIESCPQFQTEHTRIYIGQSPISMPIFAACGVDRHGINAAMARSVFKRVKDDDAVAEHTARAYDQAAGGYLAYADGDPHRVFAFEGHHTYADRHVWSVLDEKLRDLRATGVRIPREAVQAF